MNKLTISNGTEKINILLNDNKVIIGQNITAKNKIKQYLKSFFYAGDSEFRTENDSEMTLYLNDERLVFKRTAFFEVDSNYSIVEDCKLGTKSLIAKYYESVLNENEFFNSINTIDILFDSLATEISDCNELLKLLFTKMTSKQLIKLMKPYYFSEYQKDEFDLDYEDIIYFQLNIIQAIQKRSLVENTIVLVDVPIITSEVYEEICNIEHANTIVLTNNFIPTVDVQNIMIAESDYLDFADKYYVYEQFGEVNGERIIIEEVYNMIKRYLEQKYTYENVDSVEEIKSFSLKRIKI